ncbi:MAG TPA: response regulator transcription factor [Gaiellaceae bacterium]|nr:response regulator transcription factor [Gaiellaceae bacterium]
MELDEREGERQIMGEGRAGARGEELPTAVILDRYSLWLETVKRLAERSGIRVVATTTSPQQAKESVLSRKPTVFILGLEPGTMQPSALGELLQAAASVRGLTTLVVGSDDDPVLVERCLRSGAYAYILKTVGSDDLSAAIRQAVNRSVFLFARPTGAAGGLGFEPRLTARELEVLRLVAEGLPNAEVARRLWISEPTVKYHLSRTYEKLGVSNRTGAARWAERHGLLERVAS